MTTRTSSSGRPREVEITTNLSFSDKTLEQEFCDSLTQSQKFWDIVLAVLVRTTGWAFTAFKSYHRGYSEAALWMLLTCIPFSNLAVFGMMVGTEFYKKYRVPLVAGANLMNYVQVTVQYYSHLYFQGPGSPNVVQKLSALLTANGVAYLVLSTFMGALPFKWGFLMQAVYLIVLMTTNAKICADSSALRGAYSWVANALTVFSSSSSSSAGQPYDCFTESSDAAMGKPCLDNCIRYQAVLQLVLGVCLPSFLAYNRELAMRKNFLEQRRVRYEYNQPTSLDFLVFLLPTLILPWSMLLMGKDYKDLI